MSFPFNVSAAIAIMIGSNSFAELSPIQMPFEPGGRISQEIPAGYNAAARLKVQNSWDLFFSASFLYWYVDQEAMEIAINTTFTNDYQFPLDDAFVNQNFGYEPGFKIGAGVYYDYDSWIAQLEYTWYHHQFSTDRGAPPSDPRGGFALWKPTLWYVFLNNAGSGFAPWCTEFRSKWRAHIDLLDGTIGRPFYQGLSLTIHPFGGLRTAWIRQNFRMVIPYYNHATPTFTWFATSHNQSNSWGIGPRAGMSAHWLIGFGWRLEGNAAASLLYTRYTTVTHREDSTHNTTDLPYQEGFSNYGAVRPMADMNLGLGWGSYWKGAYHFDISAAYDFNIMWEQNMLRHLVNNLASLPLEDAPGDLHLQGLSVRARLDF
jgi:hypothetical protein